MMAGRQDPETITVKINGTNDGAIITPSKPGDDKGSVTEDDKLTANGKLDVVDPDKGEAVFKPQTDIAGTYGKFSIDANGNWKYELNNSDPKVQALGAGEKLTETFTVTTADGTTGTVTITVNGTNDKPTIGGVATAMSRKTARRKCRPTDQDRRGRQRQTHLVGQRQRQGQYGTFSVDTNGKWTYKLDNDRRRSKP